MSAVIKPEERLATREDMLTLFSPKTERVELSNGAAVFVRGLNVEERSRMMALDEGLDALTIMLACGVVDVNGDPIFGAYKDALPAVRALALEPELIELGKRIAHLSGMDEAAQEAIEGN